MYIYLFIFVIVFFLFYCYKSKLRKVKKISYPILTISVFACNRYIYLNQTLSALYSHLYKYEKDVNYIILYFDQGTVERKEIIEKYKLYNVFLFNPSGMELSFNAMFSYLYTDYVLLLEEDWVVENNIEKEIFYPSFILESILILSKTNLIYGIMLREADNFDVMETVNITTKMGNHTLYVGLLKLRYAYTNGASIYKSKILKKVQIYAEEFWVSCYFFSAGYKMGFTYKGRIGNKNDLHYQHVMDHIGINTSKSSICSIPLY